MAQERQEKALAAAYSHAALREKVVSLVAQLKFCRIVFGRLDKSLRNELIEKSPPVRPQISAGALQQVAKDGDFEVREIIRHDVGPRREMPADRTSPRVAFGTRVIGGRLYQR